MAAFNDFNQKIMAEFHENGGKVGGRFAGTDVLILTSTGRKSGQTRWNPLAYSSDGDRYIIVASKGGAPTSPDWYHNLVANSSAVIEVGNDVIPVEATIATGAERDRLYAQHAARMPQFNEYAKNTTRQIPVVVLTRKRVEVHGVADEILKAEPHRNVTRVGNTVYRDAGPWTPAVHALLRHLHSVGFTKVPQPIGTDEQGREMLGFMPGESGADSWAKIVPDEGLAKFAHLLREYHDAVRSFVAPPGAQWAIEEPPRATDDVICHGDFAPWNIIWRDDEPVAIIDWDFAGPGSFMEDVAYALEYATPFRSDQEAIRWLRYDAPPDRPHRMGVFASAYGLESTVGLVDRVIERQRLDAKRVARLAELGRNPQATWVRDGYLEELAARASWTETSRALFER